MKNKRGKIYGFLSGILIGFLAIVVLSLLHPKEDLAGITIIALLISGICFTFVGAGVQSYFEKKKA